MSIAQKDTIDRLRAELLAMTEEKDNLTRLLEHVLRSRIGPLPERHGDLNDALDDLEAISTVPRSEAR